MAYLVILRPAAEKSLDRLPKDVRKRVAYRIRELGDNPRPSGVLKLKGQHNLYRIRIGEYRVIYEIHDDRLIILVLYVVNRKDAY